MTLYRFKFAGDQLRDILKREMDGLKQSEPNHPVFQATKMEMVALPDPTRAEQFVTDFLNNTAKPNVMYVAILKLGTKHIRFDGDEMTGKCHNKEVKFKGTRKWETKYVLYNESVLPANYIDMFETKGEAVEAAKKYAMDHDTEVVIELEKRLNGSSSRITNISPIKRKTNGVKEVPDNQYMVFGKGA